MSDDMAVYQSERLINDDVRVCRDDGGAPLHARRRRNEAYRPAALEDYQRATIILRCGRRVEELMHVKARLARAGALIDDVERVARMIRRARDAGREGGEEAAETETESFWVRYSSSRGQLIAQPSDVGLAARADAVDPRRRLDVNDRARRWAREHAADCNVAIDAARANGRVAPADRGPQPRQAKEHASRHGLPVAPA